MYTVYDGNTPRFERQVPDSAKFDTIVFTPRDVGNCIKKLRPKLSTGPDGLSPFVIKKIGASIVERCQDFLTHSCLLVKFRQNGEQLVSILCIRNG